MESAQVFYFQQTDCFSFGMDANISICLIFSDLFVQIVEEFDC
jgi:hypothetical protein